MRPRPNDVGNFWSNVDKSGECWLWMKQLNNCGYGCFKWDGKGQLAHRVAWQIHHGCPPGNLCVLHRCDNPRCVNPSHLFLGTPKENAADRVSKGRSNPIRKLTDEQVREIRHASGLQREIADRFGIHQTTVSLIKNNKFSRQHRSDFLLSLGTVSSTDAGEQAGKR